MTIAKCTCTHAYQDSIYGYGNRLMNDTKSGQLRCTVCGTLRGSQSTTPIKVDKPIAAKVDKTPAPKVEKAPVIKTSKDTAKKDDKKSKPSLKGGKR